MSCGAVPEDDAASEDDTSCESGVVPSLALAIRSSTLSETELRDNGRPRLAAERAAFVRGTKKNHRPKNVEQLERDKNKKSKRKHKSQPGTQDKHTNHTHNNEWVQRYRELTSIPPFLTASSFADVSLRPTELQLVAKEPWICVTRSCVPMVDKTLSKLSER
jgi:hypothetical protein